MSEFTTKKLLLKTVDGGQPQYWVPYVPPASAEREGIVKLDGTTIVSNDDGTISAVNTEVNVDGSTVIINEYGQLSAVGNWGMTHTDLDTLRLELGARLSELRVDLGMSAYTPDPSGYLEDGSDFVKYHHMEELEAYLNTRLDELLAAIAEEEEVA